MSRDHQILLFLAVIAYLMGSIPFGLIIGLSKGLDPRKAGSGNIGATNVGRLLGGRYFALVFTLDVLKGLLPMLAGAYIVNRSAISPDKLTYAFWLLVGLCDILGHIFSIFINFKGGKGVATSVGVVLGVFPYFTIPALVVTTVWVIIFKLTRYVSLASIIVSALFPFAYIALGTYKHWPMLHEQLPLLIFSFIVGSLIILRHRTNITRLLNGTENRIGKKTPSTTEP